MRHYLFLRFRKAVRRVPRGVRQEGRAHHRGQTLIEFALVLPILLLLLFAIIEAARLFQAYITVQNAARNGARYGITGQCGTGDMTDRPHCIVQKARDEVAGLPVLTSVDTPGWQPAPTLPNYLDVMVDPEDFGADTALGTSDPNWQGWLTVTVTYNFSPIAPVTLNILGNEVTIIPDVVPLTGSSTLFSEVVYRVDPVTEAGYSLECNTNVDTDGDGVPDDGDNCPATANADQADNDNDNYGTACDPDDADPDNPEVGGRQLACLYIPEQSTSLGVMFTLNKVCYLNPSDTQATLTVSVTDSGSPLSGLAAGDFDTLLDGSTAAVSFSESGTPGTYTATLDISALTGAHTLAVTVTDSSSGKTGDGTAAFSRLTDCSGGGGGGGDTLSVTLNPNPSSITEGTASLTLELYVEEEGPAAKLNLPESAFSWDLSGVPGASIIAGSFTELGGGNYTFLLDTSSLPVFADYPISVDVDDGQVSTPATANAFFSVTPAGGDTLTATLTINPGSYPEGTSTLTLQVYVEEEGPAAKPGLPESAFTWTALPAGSSIVAGSFSDDGGGNYSFTLDISSLTEGTGYQVDLSVDDGAAPPATDSATFDITPPGGSSCSVSGASSFSYGSDKVKWDITNLGTADLTLRHVIVTWPDGGGELSKLKEFKWDEDINQGGGNTKIWDGPGGDTTSTTDVEDGVGNGFNKDPGGLNRDLLSGATGRLEVKFDPKQVKTSGYSYTIFAEFEVKTNPSITCSVTHSETYP